MVFIHYQGGSCFTFFSDAFTYIYYKKKFIGGFIMHSILRNAISTMNYLLLLQATQRENFPECVIDEVKLYIEGLNDLLISRETSVDSLKNEVREIVKEELFQGVYLDQSSAQEVKNNILTFYENNYAEQYPSALWYADIIDEVVAEKEIQMDL